MNKSTLTTSMNLYYKIQFNLKTQMASLGDFKIHPSQYNKVHIFPNKEKNRFNRLYEKGEQEKNYFNIPRGNKVILIGSSGVGKTNFIQNILNKRQFPVYKIYTITGNGEQSKEYDFIGDKKLRKYSVEKPPALEKLKHKDKILIIDDIDVSATSKHFQTWLGRVFSTISSHEGCLIILSSHSYSSIPTYIRRQSSWYGIFQSPDLHVIRRDIFGKHGCKPHEIDYLYDHIKSHYDFIVIDLIPNSNSMFRLNNVLPLDPKKALKKKEKEKEKD